MRRPENLYIRIEDEENFEEPMDAIVPLVFSQSRTRLELECYFGVYKEARDFLLEYGANPFFKEALSELNRRLLPYLEAEGYHREGGELRYYRSFVLWDKRKLNRSLIRPDSVMLSRTVLEKVLENRTDFDLEELLLKRLPTALTLKEGNVLSVASVNEHGKNQRLLEASVYTLPDARGQGFGQSNVALLCHSVLEKRMGVVYCCSCHNQPSLKIAKAVGFRSESRFYAVDAYKND